MSVKASTTVSISPAADRGPQLLQGQQAARGLPRLGRHQADSSRSIAASSSAVPWTFGPVNQFFAETSQ